MHWGEHQENEALVYTNATTFVLLIKCIANMVQNIWTIFVIKQMCMNSYCSSSASSKTQSMQMLAEVFGSLQARSPMIEQHARTDVMIKQ